MTTVSVAARAGWRGLIEEYRDRLPVTSDTPVVTLREGATPLVPAPVLSELTGCEIFVIANADTVMERPNAELLAEVFPGVEQRGEIGDHDTLLSIAKARRLLGYEPEFSWRDETSRRA